SLWDYPPRLAATLEAGTGDRLVGQDWLSDRVVVGEGDRGAPDGQRRRLPPSGRQPRQESRPRPQGPRRRRGPHRPRQGLRGVEENRRLQGVAQAGGGLDGATIAGTTVQAAGQGPGRPGHGAGFVIVLTASAGR